MEQVEVEALASPNGHGSSKSERYGEADLEEMVAVATRVAGQAGEHKGKAFEMVLGHLLLQGGHALDTIEETSEESRSLTPKPTRKTGNKKAAPKATPQTLDRLKPLMEANPEEIATWAGNVDVAPAKYKAHGVLIFARSKGLDGLTRAEIGAVMSNVFRLGIPKGTWTSALATTSISEIGKTPGADGNTVHRILKKGEEAWAAAGTAKNAERPA